MADFNIDKYEDKLNELEQKANKGLLALKKPGGDKTQKVKEVEECLYDLKKEFKKYNSAIINSGKKQRYDEKKKMHKNERVRLEGLLESIKSEITRKDLMGSEEIQPEKKPKDRKKGEPEYVTNPKTGKKKYKDEEMEKDLFKDIYAVQGDSIKIVERLIAKADETQEIAQESTEMLVRQREKLQKIDEEMDKLGTGIDQGKREVVSFLRRVASDKIIILVIVLVILAISGLIIWKIIESVLPRSITHPTPATTQPPTTIAPTGYF